MHKTLALLKRWIAATGGNVPYPASPNAISLEIGLQLQQADPELFAVVSGGDIPASLELAVMDGSLPDVAATPQQRQQEANAARIAQLVESLPYGSQGYYQGDEYIPGAPGNVTAAFELESLDPALAAKLKAEATPAANGGLSAADVAFVQEEMARARMESMELANYSLQEIY